MNIEEACTAFCELQNSMGPAARINVELNLHSSAPKDLFAHVYTEGPARGKTFVARANHFQSLYDEVVARWSEHSLDRDAKAIASKGPFPIIAIGGSNQSEAA